MASAEMNVAVRGENTLLGVAVIVVTVFAMSFADAIVKYVSSDLPLWQIYVVRSLIAIPIISSVSFLGLQMQLRPISIGWTMLRSLLLALMYIAIYAGVPVLSLSVIAASLYTGPLFITLFSAILIGEPVGQGRWFAIIIGFIGVLVIIRPGTDAFSVATLIPIIAAVFYALAAIITRTKCSGEKPLTLALALNYSLLLVGLVMTAAIIVWQPLPSIQTAYPFLLGNWVTMGTAEWAVIGLLAILIVGIGMGLAKAYQCGPPAVIATFDYAYLIFAAMWGFVFFSERPDMATITGMALIAISGFLAVNPQGLLRLFSMGNRPVKTSNLDR
ncbi:MAG: DMT family transporter [Methylococcales bacterium]